MVTLKFCLFGEKCRYKMFVFNEQVQVSSMIKMYLPRMGPKSP